MIFIFAILSVIIFIFGGTCVLIELINTFYNYKENKGINGSIFHSIEHLILLSLLSLGHLLFVYWVMFHESFTHSWYVHIIDESLWSVLILYGISLFLLSRHLKEERIKII